MVLSFCRGPGSIHALKPTRISSQVSICARLAVAVLGVEWTLRRVRRDVIEVNTKAVSLARLRLT